jgi:hypothetical protein
MTFWTEDIELVEIAPAPRYVVRQVRSVCSASVTDDRRAVGHDRATRRRDNSRDRGWDYGGTVLDRGDYGQYGDEVANMVGREYFCTYRELPFSEQLGVTVRHPDFGIAGLYVVRTVRTFAHTLILRPKDFETHDDLIYIATFVDPKITKVTFIGWTQGPALCSDYWWDSSLNCWRIPFSQLELMETLP